LKIGNHVFDTQNHTYVMGILNVTPDSFSDGGSYTDLDAALYRAETMLAEGAAIIDVGGESTRPGYIQISDEEEIERVCPVIQAVKSRMDVPISLDTYKSKVAMAGIESGADLINDIWGLKYDADMAKVIADNKIACCLMHNRNEADYRDFMTDMIADLAQTLRIADEAGIDESLIMLDPGVGFGKTYDNNLETIRRMSELHQFGLPILLGTSRKSVIGNTLELPSNERVEGTLATTVLAVKDKIAFVRVHDVKENVRAIKMTEKIIYG